MGDDDKVQSHETNGTRHLAMDEAFCARMRAAIKAGLERAPVGVITTPGTRSPKYVPALRDYFGCRRCYGLAYASQQESLRERGLLKAQKILIRLGAKPDLLEPFQEKPPRMHARTFERLRRVYEIARDRSIQGVLGRFPRVERDLR